MTEIIYAIDVVTIGLVVIAILVTFPLLVFLSSLTYHYAKELNKYKSSKRIDKTFNDGYEIIQKYNDALIENERLRKKISNNSDMND